MENVLLFGGTGLLGSEVRKRWRPEWGKLSVALRTVGVEDASAVEALFQETKPDIVINSAGVSNVDEAERNPLMAFEINARGAEVLASACQAANAVLIQLSTDYVFPDAAPGRPWAEKDYPDPLNEYGKSKWEGEKRVVMWPRHYVLRTSSLYGTSRSTHSKWVLDAIQTGKPVKIAEDMVGSPMYVGDLADAIGKLILKKPPFGIYHLASVGSVSRYDFAQKLCELKKVKKPYPIDKVSLASLKLAAPRAKQLLFSTAKWQKLVGDLPSWEEGLKRYLEEVDSK